MDITLTKTIDLDKFHYENIGKNYVKNAIYLGNQLMTDIGQLLAYEQGARFIQSLDIPKEKRIITLEAEDCSETYSGRYQSNKMTISPHNIRLRKYCRGYKGPELDRFFFDIGPEASNRSEHDYKKYSYFMFQVQKNDMNKVNIVYQKPLMYFGRGGVMLTEMAESLAKILKYTNTQETNAELRQEIFHENGEVLQLVVEGEFNRLRTDRQKNKMIKTIENIENKIIEMGDISFFWWV